MNATIRIAGALLRAALLCGAVLPGVAAAAGGAQAKAGSVPRNHPSTDPYTRGEAELMQRAGIVSLGGFEFGTTDTADVDRYLATNDIKWIETAHFELGFALGPHKVKQDERRRITEELTRLAEKLPDVDPRAKVLDPWLRAHMYAQRAEELYGRFLELLRIDWSVFPTHGRPLGPGGEYWGEGPHLGQKGKYEILVLPSEAASVSFLTKYFGLGIKRTQRWNVVARDTLIVVTHVQQGKLKEDAALHGHLAFNLAHNFYDGLKHYSYDTPVWLREGLAHFLEREIDPRYNSFDGSEGSVPEITSKWRWEPEVKKLVQTNGAPRLAELVRLRDYGELGLDHHFVTWSMVEFMARAHPEAFAALLLGLKGLRNEQGFADGSNLQDVQRDLFRQHFGTSYAEFDAAWQEWVKANY